MFILNIENDILLNWTISMIILLSLLHHVHISSDDYGKIMWNKMQ